MRKNGSRSANTFYRLLAAVIGLLALLSPSSVLAQESRDGLIVRDVTGGFNNVIAPGESKTYFIEAANADNSPTGNIRFTSDAPAGWLVEFNPSGIDTLAAGIYQTVEVTISAPHDARKGNYSVTVIADSSSGRRVTGIYLRVEQGTALWVWVGGPAGNNTYCPLPLHLHTLGQGLEC